MAELVAVADYITAAAMREGRRRPSLSGSLFGGTDGMTAAMREGRRRPSLPHERYNLAYQVGAAMREGRRRPSLRRLVQGEDA